MAVLIAERPAPVLQHSALLHTLGVELRVDPAICGYCALAIALACSSEVRVDLSDEIALCALIRTIAIDVLRLRRSGARRAETSVDLFALARSAVFRGVSAAPTAPIVTEVDVSRVLASRASSRVHLMRAVLVGALDPLTLRRGFAERDFADPAERAFVERERPFRAAREAFFFESYCTGNPKLRFAAD